ncbi:pseudouridine synthase [Dimargaris cristalligena]|uniref:21S rRNA pseudouridine(2819) synthase n=1 Tax=Dimargaris cristalligena TaxID=215637 RepID=A0A4Q0A0C1_9FUNG|nr:pseudouridine synthase [Dimargaris cristalligena]|eukprot:RKP39473.1 pseudouridine synthase [Dimargaris cristalligena]
MLGRLPPTSLGSPLGLAASALLRPGSLWSPLFPHVLAWPSKVGFARAMATKKLDIKAAGVQYFTPPPQWDNMRLDRLLHHCFRKPTAIIQKDIRKKNLIIAHSETPEDENSFVPLNAVTFKLKMGPNIRVYYPASETLYLPDEEVAGKAMLDTLPRQKELDSLPYPARYVSSGVLVIDKPAGIESQSGSTKCVSIDGLKQKFRLGQTEPPRLVHRLDRDTSGLLVLARTRATSVKLARLFKLGRLKKTYIAIVKGVPKRMEIGVEHVVKVPIGDVEHFGYTFRVADVIRGVELADRVESVTHVTLLETVLHTDGHTYSVLKLEPVTGRKHQLRIVCAHVLGTPIVHDPRYTHLTSTFSPDGKGSRPLSAPALSPMCLHHWRIRIPQYNSRGITTDEREAVVTAPIPRYYREALPTVDFDTLLGAKDCRGSFE